MIWTHFYDLILKGILLFTIIFVLAQIPVLSDHGIIFLLTAILLFYILYYSFVRTISTYLYCRYTLGMNINFGQARHLDGAFSPIFPLNMKWLPMTELKEVDDTEKYDVAIKIYTKWREETKESKRKHIQDFQNAKKRTKTLTVILYILCGYFLIAGLLNLPPSVFITELYCKIFHTDSYYPVLNCIIMIVPTILIFKIVDKDIK